MGVSSFKIFSLFIILLEGATCQTPEEVDFVIVGGGTAGCVLAGRLCAALPDASIVLLERASPRNEQGEFLVRAPLNTLQTWTNPLIAESYPSEPEPGLLNRVITIITGNTLGGSSSINGMQWTVPVDRTIDRWNIAGLSSSNWKRYLRRVYRKVGFAEPPEDLQQIYTNDYIDAAQRAGFQEDPRQFSDRARKALWVNRLAITPDGRRTDSCTAYVSPVLETKCRLNLRIIQSATASRVLLNDETPPRAYGVEYVLTTATNSETREIHATKEVLLSAGPYESPKLLQLSGIGPRDVLENAGVGVKLDLGVGTKTQARVRNNVVSIYSGVPPEPSSNLTLLNLPESLMQWEDGEGGVFGVGVSCCNGILKRSAYFTAVFRLSAAGPDGLPILASTCLPNPNSFGYLRIKDNNPFSKPVVKLNMLGTGKEVRRLRACMSALSEVHAQFTPPFQLLPVSPPPGDLSEPSLRNSSDHSYHFVGGNAVGTVVKSNLKVRGVQGLRVIDASVFRTMPISAGPMSSTYVLAEFMAERLGQMYKTK